MKTIWISSFISGHFSLQIKYSPNSCNLWKPFKPKGSSFKISEITLNTKVTKQHSLNCFLTPNYNLCLCLVRYNCAICVFFFCICWSNSPRTFILSRLFSESKNPNIEDTSFHFFQFFGPAGQKEAGGEEGEDIAEEEGEWEVRKRCGTRGSACAE